MLTAFESVVTKEFTLSPIGILVTGKRESLWSVLTVPRPFASEYKTLECHPPDNCWIAQEQKKNKKNRKSFGTTYWNLSRHHCEKRFERNCSLIQWWARKENTLLILCLGRGWFGCSCYLHPRTCNIGLWNMGCLCTCISYPWSGNWAGIMLLSFCRVLNRFFSHTTLYRHALTGRESEKLPKLRVYIYTYIHDKHSYQIVTTL